jgi:transposase
MTFVGFDLHRRYITACALHATGGVVGEVRQLATALERVLEWLAALPLPVTVAMATTLYREWPIGQLQEAGHAVRVADAYQAKLIWQARSKTDPIDARKLAELLRMNLPPTIWAPDLEARRHDPSWSPCKLLALLRRQEQRRGQEFQWPARSTVAELLRRTGLTTPRRRWWRRRASSSCPSRSRCCAHSRRTPSLVAFGGAG